MVLSVLLLTGLLTGCWNRRELNELAITVGLGLDVDDEGNYVVSAQVVNPSSIANRSGSGSGSAVVTYVSKASTVYEAVRKITKQSPRKIYVAHLRILIIGEKLARQGVAPVLDLLARDYEVRNDFYVTVAKDATAQDVLSVFTPLEVIPAEKIFSTLTTAEKAFAPSIGIYLDELLTSIMSKSKSPVLTGIIINGNMEEGKQPGNISSIDPPTRLEIGNLALFKKDRLITWFNEKESKGYNYITNNVENTVGHIPCPDGGLLNLELIHVNTKFKAEMRRKEPLILIKSRVEANIGEVMCKVDISDPKVIDELETSAKKTLIDIMGASIKKAQKYKADIYGFGEAVHRRYPQEWKAMEKDWPERFADIKVEYKIDYAIRRTGTLNRRIIVEGE
ncbi:hypothetical protein SY83_19410 [Paenibacillus swuensis]|uniref:Uncharacterized protein n=1 Tax=Paenibacillus swuensis TaxID=1178515 RepID=A0A172TPS8_9BACL|nr:hypothetical protein SY83_19410 [Paenibacillus swuensis]